MNQYLESDVETIFQVPIENPDIAERFFLPNDRAGHVWGPNDPPQMTFRVQDPSNASWDLRGHRIFGQGILRHEVSGSEWRRFARANKLQVGDQLVFSRHRYPDPARRVAFFLKIERAVRLMGVDFVGYTN